MKKGEREPKRQTEITLLKKKGRRTNWAKERRRGGGTHSSRERKRKC